MTQQLVPAAAPGQGTMLSKAATLGLYEQQMTSLELSKLADQAAVLLKSDSPFSGIAQIHFLADYAPEIIARIGAGGTKFNSDKLCSGLGLDMSMLGIESEFISGPQAMLVIREAHFRYLQFEGQQNWFMEAQEIFEAFEREEFKTAGYDQWYLYIEMVKPGGLDRTQATNRLNLMRYVRPRVEALGYSLTQVFSKLKPAISDDLVPFLRDPNTLDNDGLKFVIELIDRGDVRTRSQVAALRVHPAIAIWTKFAMTLRGVGLDPVQRALDLGLERLGPVAKFVTRGDLRIALGDNVNDDGTPVPGFLTQMTKLSPIEVAAYCDSHHARSADHEAPGKDNFDDDYEEESEEKAAPPRPTQGNIAPLNLAPGIDVVSLPDELLDGMTRPGALDEHTQPVLQVETADDYITGTIVLPIRLAQALEGAVGLKFMWDGVPHTVKAGVLVKKR